MITGDDARRDAHRWRACSCAVLTGIGTVRDDDPQLNVRAIPTDRQPLRVVVDARLDTPLNARLLGDGHLLIAAPPTTRHASPRCATGGRNRRDPAQPGAAGRPARAAAELGRRGINEVLLKSGFKLNGPCSGKAAWTSWSSTWRRRWWAMPPAGLFNLPALESLADKRRLAFRTSA